MKLSRQVWIIAAMLAACSTPAVMQWEKPGASQATATTDADQCREQARVPPLLASSSAPVTPGAAPVLTREEERALHESENFQKCMRERGYSAKR